MHRQGNAMKQVTILIVAVVTLGAAAALAAAGPGYRFGVWELSTAFAILRAQWLVIAALAGAAASVIAALVALFSGPRALVPLALVAAVAGGSAGYGPIALKQDAEARPFLHDITTDFSDPPRIVAGADAPRRNPPEYLGDQSVRESDPPTSELQRRGYPDIVPVYRDAPPAAVADQTRAVLQRMRIKILDQRTLADGGIEIEGVATTFWFGFKDDFVVRIRPDNTGSRVDIRSKSRIGGTDLGANAKRVRRFAQRIRES
jgi:uncharacterized protein (DUF1499 family)